MCVCVCVCVCVWRGGLRKTKKRKEEQLDSGSWMSSFFPPGLKSLNWDSRFIKMEQPGRTMDSTNAPVFLLRRNDFRSGDS